MTLNIAIRTSDLIDHFGVVTHLAYTDGGYRELSTTTNALRYLGIDHVRDEVTNPTYDAYGQAHYAQAAASGIHFTFLTDGRVDPGTEVARIRAIEQAYPGSVTAIEGPNEVNNFPFSYKGASGTAAAQSYMRDLFNAVQADALLRDITVTGFTDYPNRASTSDASAIHPYAKEGDQPRGRILQDMADQNAVDPGKAFYITETGYHTKIDPSYGWEGVSEATQAKLILNTYMDGVLLGAKQTYVYQLLDAYAGNSQEEHFGLFRLDNSPKPAATAIHNLTTILNDGGSNAGSFGTGALDVTVSNAPASGQTLLTQKSNGSYQIITWAEPDIWNQASNQAISVAATNEIISFGTSFQTVEVFDPLVSTAPIQTYYNVSSVSVGVTDHPLIVQLSGGVGAQSLAPSPSLSPSPAVAVAQPQQPLPPVSLSAGLVDTVFYLGQNPDVLAAGMDAATHYNGNGRFEGRHPNAYFDTTAYLTTYGDVAAAGINPMEHYLINGWREGRDPSPHFDTDAYLAAYQDVAAAQMNPLVHFLAFGRPEGRFAFSDGVMG